MTYQDSWPFWLDDACYCIARGVRYLALPSEVDTAEQIVGAIVGLMAKIHGPRIVVKNALRH